MRTLCLSSLNVKISDVLIVVPKRRVKPVTTAAAEKTSLHRNETFAQRCFLLVIYNFVKVRFQVE